MSATFVQLWSLLVIKHLFKRVCMSGQLKESFLWHWSWSLVPILRRNSMESHSWWVSSRKTVKSSRIINSRPGPHKIVFSRLYSQTLIIHSWSKKLVIFPNTSTSRTTSLKPISTLSSSHGKVNTKPSSRKYTLLSHNLCYTKMIQKRKGNCSAR